MKVKIQAQQSPDIHELLHYYNVGSNKDIRFTLGNVGALNDFWLTGFAVPSSLSYPLLSGTLLDHEGQPLVRLVDSQITFNPAACERVFSTENNGLSYRIVGTNGETVMLVETTYSETMGYMTRISGEFYDKTGSLIVTVTEDMIEADPSITVSIGGKESGQPLTDAQVDFMNIVVVTKGTIGYMLSGEFTDVSMVLDGAYLHNFKATNCKFTYSLAIWISDFGPVYFNECSHHMVNMAAFISDIAKQGSFVGSGSVQLGIRDAYPEL
jgi:hypothetical protein